MIGVELFREGLSSFEMSDPARTLIPYTYNLSYSIFPISEAREEPYDPRAPKGTPATLASESVEVLSAHLTSRPIKEIPGFPGVLEDGRWTARHPLVQIYLTNLGDIYDDVTGFTGASTSRGEPARDVRGCIRVGRVEDVGQVVGGHLSTLASEIVFTLAALEVVDIVRHPVHFAFWGADVRERTSQIIQRIQSMRITSLLPLSLPNFMFS